MPSDSAPGTSFGRWPGRTFRRSPTSNRSRMGGKCCDQLGAAPNQGGNALNSMAVIGQPLRDAVDHLLLLGRKLQPRFLQQRSQRRGRLRDLIGRRRRIGDEIARCQPQLIGAAVDFLRYIANALKVLQFGKGRIDVADRDHAGDAGNHDHRQQQYEAGKGELSDRQRKRPYPSDDCGKGHGLSRPARDSLLLYAGISAEGNMPACRMAGGPIAIHGKRINPLECRRP